VKIYYIIYMPNANDNILNVNDNIQFEGQPKLIGKVIDKTDTAINILMHDLGIVYSFTQNDNMLTPLSDSGPIRVQTAFIKIDNDPSVITYGTKLHPNALNSPTNSVNPPTNSVNSPTNSVNPPTNSVNSPTNSVNSPTHSVNSPANSVNSPKAIRVNHPRRIPPPPALTYVVGDPVLLNAEKMWYPCIIKTVNDDGTYIVHGAADDTDDTDDTNVRVTQIQPMMPYTVGTSIRYSYHNNMQDGLITKVDGDEITVNDHQINKNSIAHINKLNPKGGKRQTRKCKLKTRRKCKLKIRKTITPKSRRRKRRQA